MADIDIEYVDNTYVNLRMDRSIREEVKDAFSFYAPNYKWHPKYKAGYWDGRISILRPKNNHIWFGLVPDIVEFCTNRDYTYSIDQDITDSFSDYKITDELAIEFYNKIGGPFEPLDSQLTAFTHCINNGRAIILAPTSNGKSYIIHGLAAFYALQKKRILIIIDRSQLVEQLRSNLRDEYHGDQSCLEYHTVFDKIDPKKSNVFITTWQSIYENPVSWFKQFDVLIGDEIHKFKADSIKGIIEKCGHIDTRFGFTATLDNDSKTDRLTLIGMFGTPLRVATTKQLIEEGVVARPTVYAITRKYSPTLKREIYRNHGQLVNKKYVLDFVNEVKFLENSDERNNWIAKIRKTIKGNTLIAFKREEHGNNILNALEDIPGEKYFINHTVDKFKRIEYSKLIDQSTDATGVVSLGTTSTGINIKNINNIIVACQVKSKITVPQLIGRGLRKSEIKTTVNIYDVGDDLTLNGKANATYNHFLERLQIYADEGFEIKLLSYNVE